MTQLERMVELRDSNIYQMHLDSKNRVRILQGIVSDLRARMSGVVLLTKHEVMTQFNVANLQSCTGTPQAKNGS